MNLVSLPRLNELRFPADPQPMAKLWRWCREGRLPGGPAAARKIGGEWFVDLDAFDCGGKAPPEPVSSQSQAVLDRLRHT